jgi:hypothetical protein
MAVETTVDIGNCVIAGCAVVGLYSLRAFVWQSKWQHRHELAKKLLLAAFKFRNEIRLARFGVAKENADSLCKRYSEAAGELEMCALESEAVWGDRLADAETKLLAVGLKFWLSFRRLQRIKEAENGQIPPSQRDEYIRLEELVYGGDDSAFGKTLLKAVADLRAIVGKYIPAEDGRTLQARVLDHIKHISRKIQSAIEPSRHLLDRRRPDAPD